MDLTWVSVGSNSAINRERFRDLLIYSEDRDSPLLSSSDDSSLSEPGQRLSSKDLVKSTDGWTNVNGKNRRSDRGRNRGGPSRSEPKTPQGSKPSRDGRNRSGVEVIASSS